ncbi:MAG: ABC transporter permease, partial [Actinomycetota bacterium]
MPRIVAEIQTGGEKVTATVRPSPMTDAERQVMRDCIEKNGGFSQGGGGGTPSPGEGPGPGRGNNAAFDKCMPERFKQYEASVTTPLRTIQQVVNPPSTDITNRSYTAAGIDPSNSQVGLVTETQLTAGRWLASGAPNEVLVNVAYATKNSLAVGSTVAINGTDYSVVGLVNPTLTGNTADLYFPLTTLQTLSGKEGRVTQVLVKASSAASVDKVAAEIEKILPGAEVVTTKTLAEQVTGSLADAQKLASRFGGAVGAIVLGAAFVIAVLLTLSSVAKRVREIGTLRAIGWGKGRVVRQILVETLGIGVLGGAMGVALGFAAAFAVGVFSPELTATTTGVPGFAGSSVSPLFGQATQATAQTSTLALKAPVHLATLGIGVGLAI